MTPMEFPIVERLRASFNKAFAGMLIGGIIAITLGAIMLMLSYLILNGMFGAVGTISNTALNTSMYANMSNITTALGLGGLSIIAVGVVVVISAFTSIAPGTGR